MVTKKGNSKSILLVLVLFSIIILSTSIIIAEGNVLGGAIDINIHAAGSESTATGSGVSGTITGTGSGSGSGSGSSSGSSSSGDSSSGTSSGSSSGSSGGSSSSSSGSGGGGGGSGGSSSGGSSGGTVKTNNNKSSVTGTVSLTVNQNNESINKTNINQTTKTNKLTGAVIGTNKSYTAIIIITIVLIAVLITLSVYRKNKVSKMIQENNL